MNELRSILEKARAEELQGLAEILEVVWDTDTLLSQKIESLVSAFEDYSRSVFGTVFGADRSYHEIVAQAADKLGVSYSRHETTAEIEARIAREVFETVWEKMTEEQRQQMEEELKKTAQKFDKGGPLLGSGSMFVALTAAKLSGFGVYLLASTSLGALTATLGLTLPFAVYTTMSSAIAVILGPAGWIGLALLAIWKLTGPNYKRLIPAILYVSMLRVQPENDGSGWPFSALFIAALVIVILSFLIW